MEARGTLGAFEEIQRVNASLPFNYNLLLNY